MSLLQKSGSSGVLTDRHCPPRGICEKRHSIHGNRYTVCLKGKNDVTIHRVCLLGKIRTLHPYNMPKGKIMMPLSIKCAYKKPTQLHFMLTTMMSPNGKKMSLKGQ